MKRRGRSRKTSSGFDRLVRKLGGVRPAARALCLDASYVCLIRTGRRPLTDGVIDRIASLGQPERPA